MCEIFSLIGATIATGITSAGTAIAGGAAAGSLAGGIGTGLMGAGAAMGSASALTGATVLGLGATAGGLGLANATGAFDDKQESSSSTPTSVEQIQQSKQASGIGSGNISSPSRSAIAAMASQGVRTSAQGLEKANTVKKPFLGV